MESYILRVVFKWKVSFGSMFKYLLKIIDLEIFWIVHIFGMFDIQS